MHETMSWLEEYIFGELLRMPPELWPNCANLNLYKDGPRIRAERRRARWARELKGT